MVQVLKCHRNSHALNIIRYRQLAIVSDPRRKHFHLHIVTLLTVTHTLSYVIHHQHQQKPTINKEISIKKMMPIHPGQDLEALSVSNQNDI